MITGDGAYIKKINRGIILREIIKHVAISRADLSKITGLNKATISVQVADLIKENLIIETEHVHHSVGRRPIMLSINRKAGFVLGIDLDYKQIQYRLSDLSGMAIETKTSKLKTENYDEVVNILIKQIQSFQEKYKNNDYGLISMTIGIHGTVSNEEQINFVPKFNWHEKNLKEDMAKEINLPINIENNANLSAYAEKVYEHPATNNLLAINLTSGIGAGMMINGELHKGYNGFAGEMGHMIIVPDGEKCRCGNKGCWELYASETSFIEQIARHYNDHLTRQDVIHLIVQKDEYTMKQLQKFIDHLTIGLNNVINIYNPETLVLSSELLQAFPQSIQLIEEKLTSSVSNYEKIALSHLGNQSCVMGACALSIQQFLQVPELMIHTASQIDK